MFDLQAILTSAFLYATSAAFLAGLLITTITGESKPVKTLIIWLSVITTLAVAGGMVFTRGILVYLLFQIIALMLVLYLIILAGAACGYGIYLLRHKKPLGKSLSDTDLVEYLTIAEFAAQEGTDVERVLSRIKNGYYQGGRYQKAWYVHKSELQRDKANGSQQQRPQIVEAFTGKRKAQQVD